MTPRLLASTLLACLACASPALASGGVSCTAEDRGAKFSIGSPVGRSTGGALYQFAGEIEVRGPSVAEDFRKITLAASHLTQSWFDARDLKMHVHFEREAEPHGTVDLTVEVRGRAEAPTWRGRYTLSIGETVDGEFRTRRITGRVTCSVEG
jgi:autotransporter translocation and assembly factor TamB